MLPRNNFTVRFANLFSLGGVVRRDSFYKCEYDLTEIQSAAEADSYLKVAMQRYKQLFFKAGYVFRGKNDSAIEYLKKRFRIMEYISREPVDTMFKEIAGDLEMYSNAFLIKTRGDNIPTINAKGITKSGKPVVCYCRVHPATMQAKYNDDGVLIGYKQQIFSGREKEFDRDDVIHFTLDREAGSIWGTPRWIAVLDDIKLLRKVEANVLALIYRFSMPLVHVKVGLPEAGREGTQKDVDETQKLIERAPMDGMFVTTEGVSMEAVGTNGSAIDSTGYLSYFEKRVFSGMNVSESMMGRGGAKQDASTMEENAHNIIKADQQVFSSQVKEAILNELLLEGGFNPITNEDDIVTFDFNEISLDTKIKMENNELYKFEKNAITFEEMRDNLGMVKDNVDEDRLYSNMIAQKNTLEQMKQQSNAAMELAKLNGDIQMDVAKQSAKLAAANNPSGSSSNSNTSKNTSSQSSSKNKTKSSYTKKNTGNGKTKDTHSKSKAVDSINTPKNQYGKHSMKVGESIDTDSPGQRTLSDIYEKMSEDITKSTISTADIVISGYEDQIKKSILTSIDSKSEKGCKEALIDTGNEDKLKDVNMSFQNQGIINYSNNAISNFFSDIKNISCNEQSERDAIKTDLGNIKYRLRFIADYVEKKSYWYSYAKTLNHVGIEKMVIQCGENSRHKDKHNTVLSTSDFNIDEIPGYGSGCSCFLVPYQNDS